jgi:hypothetical protein
MIKRCAFMLLLMASNVNAQIIPNNIDSVYLIFISDSVSYDLNKFTADYALEMSTWSEERLKWFNKNFRYTRGHITIPEEPIVIPNWDE